jgi:phosphoglycolate phosphatase
MQFPLNDPDCARMSKKSVFFDLDGTLIDTFPGIKESIQYALTGSVSDSVDALSRNFIGPPIKEIFLRLIHDLTEDKLLELENRFRYHHDHIGFKNCAAYPGIDSTLHELVRRKYNLFIVTNKPESPTTQIIKRLQWENQFLEMVSPDSIQPDFSSKGEAVKYLLSKWKIKAAEVVMVGDSLNDAEAADENGIDFIGVSYGYGSFTNLSQNLVKHMIHDVRLLIDLIN